MTVTKDFSCILCAEQSSPWIIQHKVKGDHHEMLKVVCCSSCGHLQLNPPMYSNENLCLKTHYKVMNVYSDNLIISNYNSIVSVQ